MEKENLSSLEAIHIVQSQTTEQLCVIHYKKRFHKKMQPMWTRKRIDHGQRHDSDNRICRMQSFRSKNGTST